MRRTIKCLLSPTPPMAEALRVTTEKFAGACNAILEHSRKLKTSNKVLLQRACYREIRKAFGLTSNLAIRAIARVAFSVKIATKRGKYVGRFNPTSVDYDARIFDFREKDEAVSLSTVRGRFHIPLDIGTYQRGALAGKSPTCARLVRNGKNWEIHIAVEETEPPKRGGPPLGIDLGIKNIATMSTGKRISGAKTQAIKDRYARVRASLQSKGTRGARRLLKQLSGRERRYISWVNHNVSKSIVQEAMTGGFGITRFEDLRYIRERTRSWSKHRNRMISGWSFGELQMFTTYKAIRVGLGADFVNPAWTSQTCSWCGVRGLRNGELFVCITCGPAHADWNAARNIAAGGVRARDIPAVRNGTRISDQLFDFFSHTG